MPKRFTFKIPEEGHEFSCKLSRARCMGTNKTGKRCGRFCITPYEYCYLHLQNILHLRVFPSSLPNGGKGLYAYSPEGEKIMKQDRDRDPIVIFRRGDTICEYKGEDIPRQTVVQRYRHATAPYAVEKNRRRDATDSACKRGIGSFANTARRRNENNSVLIIEDDKPYLVASKKTIRHRDEIFCDYGPEYELNEPGVSFTTKNSRK
jgi:hypothetical protein